MLDHEHEFIGGAPALDFANTLGGDRRRPSHDHLGRYADLVEFARLGGLIGPAQAATLLVRAKTDPLAAAAVLERALKLRAAIWGLLAPDEPVQARGTHLKVVSDEAALAAANLRLVRRGETFAQDWSDEPHLDRVLWPVARSAAEILTSEVERAAVRECESETCTWLFLDRTRNHSRRWCDMKDCGNRAKSRRFRERRRSAV